MDPYQGFHRRMREDSNGYYIFKVYPWKDEWYWTSVTNDGYHVGFKYGPFDSAKDAYLDSVKDEVGHALA